MMWEEVHDKCNAVLEHEHPQTALDRILELFATSRHDQSAAGRAFNLFCLGFREGCERTSKAWQQGTWRTLRGEGEPIAVSPGWYAVDPRSVLETAREVPIAIYTGDGHLFRGFVETKHGYHIAVCPPSEVSNNARFSDVDEGLAWPEDWRWTQIP